MQSTLIRDFALLSLSSWPCNPATDGEKTIQNHDGDFFHTPRIAAPIFYSFSINVHDSLGLYLAWTLTRWLEEGAFEALQKQYLRALVFNIFLEKKDSAENQAKKRVLVESYMYHVEVRVSFFSCLN